MKRLLILLVLPFFLISGCAMTQGAKTKTTESIDAAGNPVTTTVTEPGPLFGASDYDTHGEMYKTFEQETTLSIKAVVAAPLTAKTDEGRGYEAGMKYMAVQSIANRQFTQKKPTTMNDNIGSLIGQTPALATIRAFDHIGTALVDKAGGTVNNSGGGTVTLDHSMNTNHTEATNVGQGSATSSTPVDDHTNKQNPVDNSVTGEPAATEPVVE
jgi:hypothetical protein